MKDIAIFGAGAYGQEIYCLIRKINSSLDMPKWNFVGFFDDDEKIWHHKNRYGEVLGGMDTLNNWNAPLDVVVAIANVSYLKKAVNRIVNPYIEFPNIIDPDTCFLDMETFEIGKGNIIGEITRFATNVKMGDFNIVVNDGVFGHDDVIGNFNVFFPDVRFSGNVKCGDYNLFGVRSTVLQGLKIGNSVKLSAGCILMNNSQDGCVYRGNPARKFIM
jgi:acetyltransferase-like isoleucine patch superfamily enzyme